MEKQTYFEESVDVSDGRDVLWDEGLEAVLQLDGLRGVPANTFYSERTGQR